MYKENIFFWLHFYLAYNFTNYLGILYNIFLSSALIKSLELIIYNIFGGLYILVTSYPSLTASMVQWSEFLATDPKVPDSIPGATRFSKK
jgi:hypothetical protein